MQKVDPHTQIKPGMDLDALCGISLMCGICLIVNDDALR